MKTSSHLLRPIDPATADQLRTAGGPVHIADEHPGYPCRQCLRDAAVGERVILVSHDPFPAESTSPYRSASPIFLHERPCAPPVDLVTPPAQLTCRQLSVRAFDRDHQMTDAAVVDGVDLDTTLRRFFDDADTDVVHIHNASRGCWATAVTRDP